MKDKSVVAVAGAGGSNPVERVMELIGGIGLKPGQSQRILIKPNVVFGLRPSTGTVTNPLVIESLIRYLVSGGAEPGDITAGECSAMGYDTEKAFRMSGISDVCKRHGIRTAVFFRDGHVTKDIRFMGKTLPVQLAREIFDADLLINVPVIKTHFQSGVSMGLKNMLGAVSWESRKTLHKIGLSSGIAHLNSLLPEYVTIGDATVGLHGKGPTLLGKPGNWNLVFASRDPVAHDSKICEIFGLETPEHVRKAAELGLGLSDTKRIGLLGEKMEAVKRRIQPATGDISPLKNAFIVDGDACSYCMNYVWTVLLRLSKERGLSGKEIEILIGIHEKEPGTVPKRERVICGDCAVRHIKSGKCLPGCPPGIGDIYKTIKEALSE